MYTYLPPTIQESFRVMGEDFLHEGRRVIYEAPRRIAQYLLTTHETITSHAKSFASSGFKAAERAILWINTQCGVAAALCGYFTFRAYSVIESSALWINDIIGNFSGLAGLACHKTASLVADSTSSMAKKTIRFIKDNWKYILVYLFAWGVVVACSGALYGFTAVTLPLTIGFGVGLVVGGLIGILTCKIFDPENRYSEKNTIWGLLNLGIGKLDPNGTRQIVLAISVTVLLAASVIFPYALGGVFGLMIGDQIVTKIGLNDNLGPNPADLAHQLNTMQNELRRLQRQIQLLQSQEAIEIAAKVERLQQRLQQLQEVHGHQS